MVRKSVSITLDFELLVALRQEADSMEYSLSQYIERLLKGLTRRP